MSTPRVTLCVLSDRPAHLRVLLAALQVQTATDWSVIVVDQTQDLPVWNVVTSVGDPRIDYRRVPDRRDWGQTEKFRAAVECARAEFVGFPNDDAYYSPHYLELMLNAAEGSSLDLVYCDWVNAKPTGLPFAAFAVRPEVGYVDVGGFLVRRQRLVEHGWPDVGPTGDGLLIESLIRSGVRHARIPCTLYVHN